MLNPSGFVPAEGNTVWRRNELTHVTIVPKQVH